MDLNQQGGGFPNRRRKFQGKLALILQDLFPLLCCGGHVFALSCAKSASNKLRQCGKLLKPNRGEVAEWLNAAVC
jgi:hypothetical protein